jgi:hypothetical protein
MYSCTVSIDVVAVYQSMQLYVPIGVAYGLDRRGTSGMTNANRDTNRSTHQGTNSRILPYVIGMVSDFTMGEVIEDALS